MDMNAKASQAHGRRSVVRLFRPPCVPNADKKAGRTHCPTGFFVPNADKKAGRTMRPRKEYGGIP